MLAFEYGDSTVNRDALVVWGKSQFGDFSEIAVAQVVIESVHRGVALCPRSGGNRSGR
ncbi:hypothetical protein ACFFYR_02005 [Paraburkholderia dipogonis]|uniref:hypothetical protein n=1 Tax=Paraburkholderia dipogonis TaxID=1211383 RepID=UPI0035EEDBED